MAVLNNPPFGRGGRISPRPRAGARCRISRGEIDGTSWAQFFLKYNLDPIR